MTKLFTICKNEVFFTALEKFLLSHHIVLSGICKDPEHVVDMYSLHSPDVVLLDFNWATKNINGIELFNRLLQHDMKCKVIFTSTHYEHQFAAVARISGAKGYLYRNVDPMQRFVDAIRQVHQGSTFFVTETNIASHHTPA